MRFTLLAALLALATTLAAAPDEEGGRFALVIGNNSYTTSPLQNAVNDARAMEKSLKDAGFRVTKVENATLQSLNGVLGEFVSKLGPSDTALFFYAGHGLQIAGENFMVPVDFEPKDSILAAKFTLVSIARLFDELRDRNPKRSIVVLDACRTNAVARQYALSAGLAQPQNAPNESYVVFSTGPGQTAADNPNGRNSYFTEALAEEVTKPGQTIEEVVNRVRATVSAETGGKQTPWALSSLKNTFYFLPPGNLETQSVTSLAAKWMSDAKRFEQREEWDEAIDRVDQVIQKNAGGSLQAAAQSRKLYLEARRDAQAAFDRGDFKVASQKFEDAVQRDPFSAGAALGGVDSYLLMGQLDEAVRLLHAIEVRGGTEDAAKATAMLAELKTVNQAAAKEVATPAPAPPPIEEMFAGIQFGVPDWDSAGHLLDGPPIDQSAYLREIAAKAPPLQPATDAITAAAQQAANSAAALAQLLKSVYHVEVVPSAETRDIAIGRFPDSSQTSNSNGALLQIDYAGAQMPVVFEGKLQNLPASLPVQPGKYEIKTVRNGVVVDTQSIEVTAGSPQTITIKK